MENEGNSTANNYETYESLQQYIRDRIDCASKKYRIKDSALETKIRQLYNTDYGYQQDLNEYCRELLADDEPTIDIEIRPEDSVTGGWIQVQIKKSDVEEVEYYDPDKWNEFPKVVPPQKGWYRVETFDGPDNQCKRWALEWTGTAWENPYPAWYAHKFRFKPWDVE